MKKTITTLALVFFCILINAQTASLKWGPIYEDKDCSDGYFFCYGQNENGYYRNTYHKKNKVVQKFNNQHQIVASKELNYNTPNEKLFGINASLFINKELYCFAYTGSSKVITMYRKKFSEDLGEESEWEEFDKFVDISQSNISNDVLIEKSEDESKFIIYIENKNKELTITGKAYDKDFNKIWDKEFDLKTGYWEYPKPIKLLTNDGAFIYFGRFEKKKGDDNYSTAKERLILCDKNGISSYEFGVDKNFVSNITLMLDNETKKITLAGFYSDKETGFYEYQTQGSDIGYLYKEIDLNTRKIAIDVVKAFDPTVMVKDTYKKQSQEINLISSKYLARKMVKRENGEISMVSEYSQMFSSSVSNFPDYGNYAIQDILVVNFDQKGNMTKTFIIPKKQLTGALQMGSFLLHIVKNKLVFVFYDNERNNGKKGYAAEEVTLYRGDINTAVIASITCDFDGNISQREIIYKKGKSDKNVPYLNIGKAKKINENKYFVEDSRNKNYQCGYITFE